MVSGREEAIQLLEKMPEEEIQPIIQYMRSVQIRTRKSTQGMNEKLMAVNKLKSFADRFPKDFDCDKELEEALEEKMFYY